MCLNVSLFILDFLGNDKYPTCHKWYKNQHHHLIFWVDCKHLTRIMCHESRTRFLCPIWTTIPRQAGKMVLTSGGTVSDVEASLCTVVITDSNLQLQWVLSLACSCTIKGLDCISSNSDVTYRTSNRLYLVSVTDKCIPSFHIPRCILIISNDDKFGKLFAFEEWCAGGTDEVWPLTLTLWGLRRISTSWPLHSSPILQNLFISDMKFKTKELSTGSFCFGLFVWQLDSFYYILSILITSLFVQFSGGWDKASDSPTTKLAHR